MTRLHAVFVLFVLAAGLAACDGRHSFGWGGDKDTGGEASQQSSNLRDNIAIINGQPVSKATYDLYVKLRKEQRPHERIPEKKELTNELVNLELLSQEAVKTGLSKTPDVLDRLRFQRVNLLAGAMIEKLLRNAKVSNDQIKQEYARLYANKPNREYKTRNILVAKKEQAEQIIAQLEKGADFAQLARTRSIGPAKATGGALQWFKPDDVLANFANAVAGLKKGEFTRQPVLTSYGWHVILLEDVREVPAPPLDKVKDRIHTNLISQQLEQHIKQLRSRATIETPATSD